MQISWTMTYDGLWDLGRYPCLKCTHPEEIHKLYVIYDFHLKNLGDVHLDFQKSKLNFDVPHLELWMWLCKLYFDIMAPHMLRSQTMFIIIPLAPTCTWVHYIQGRSWVNDFPKIKGLPQGWEHEGRAWQFQKPGMKDLPLLKTQGKFAWHNALQAIHITMLTISQCIRWAPYTT